MWRKIGYANYGGSRDSGKEKVYYCMYQKYPICGGDFSRINSRRLKVRMSICNQVVNKMMVERWRALAVSVSDHMRCRVTTTLPGLV
jgi:hypothetical protein